MRGNEAVTQEQEPPGPCREHHFSFHMHCTAIYEQLLGSEVYLTNTCMAMGTKRAHANDLATRQPLTVSNLVTHGVCCSYILTGRLEEF